MDGWRRKRDRMLPMAVLERRGLCNGRLHRVAFEQYFQRCFEFLS